MPFAELGDVRLFYTDEGSGDRPVPFVQRLVGGMDSPARLPALRTWQVRRIAGMAGHVLRQSLRAQTTGMALRSCSEPYLRRRNCPVLTFYADPARAAVERAVFTDPRSRVVTWEGVGHWLHQERPAEFNTLVTGWLASIAQGVGAAGTHENTEKISQRPANTQRRR